MKIVLQDIIPPIVSVADDFKKILLMSGEHFYQHDLPQNEYHELALHALEIPTIQKSRWKKISSDGTQKILQHVTRSRNIFCSTSDARSLLHTSSYTLNAELEIIPISSRIRANIMNEINLYSTQGYRVSGIAIKKIESQQSATRHMHGGIFIALVLHEYFLQPDASSTVDSIKNNNKNIIIFSNELLPTCKWFARKIGINATDDFCIISDDLQSMTDAELLPLVEIKTVFAEMNPIDKIRVSRLLAKQGHELRS